MQLKRNFRHKRSQSLIPLIDVMFFLVIFFMLTTTFTVYDAMPLQMDKVELFSEDKGENQPAGENDAIVITVDKEQHIIVNDKRMMVNDLRYYLLMQLKTNPDRQIVLEAKPEASVQDVVVVIDQIRLSGGRNLAIAGV